MIVDLHGMTEEESIGPILSAILSFEYGDVDFVEFITGRGTVLTRAVEEALEDAHIFWEHPNGNTGCYLIKK